ncbi:hypothetical protein CDAR_442911 [Caerostris darwini]|uniref:Uncharacterized protein n=1 Tax=Caerostris darwini TaxID=1538125 RepID=A0AAV4VNT7_9ARAC|nr:hypothetical protein CDAR_442911 [Caerostris darwini]
MRLIKFTLISSNTLLCLPCSDKKTYLFANYEVHYSWAPGGMMWELIKVSKEFPPQNANLAAEFAARGHISESSSETFLCTCHLSCHLKITKNDVGYKVSFSLIDYLVEVAATSLSGKEGTLVYDMRANFGNARPNRFAKEYL